MKKLVDYKDKCGSCVHYERFVKDGELQEHGQCFIRDKVKYHNSSQKCCRQYEAVQGS